MDGVVIRQARKEDCDDIVGLVIGLAEFEKMADQVKTTVEDYVRDGFETDPPAYHCFVAENEGMIVGCALYYYLFSIENRGRYIYLEDLYIKQAYRRHGIGTKLLQAVTRAAQEQGCSCVQWCVLDWNTKAIEFYQNIGAVDLTLKDGKYMYKMITKS